MTAKIIDGKKLASQITDHVKKEIEQLGFAPGLAVFLIGDDEASKLYVKLKERASKKVGIDFHKYLCEEETAQQDILEAIDFLNRDDHVNAILVQLPLPESFDEQTVIDKLDPSKDVDGFHPQTMRDFLSGKNDFIPGLSEGIVRLIESTNEPLQNKQAVIIANSEIFSQPLTKLLSDRGVKTSVVAPDDKQLAQTSVAADILITAVGRPEFIDASMIKEGSIVIDVGTTREDERVVGDVDFASVKKKAGYVTPVPGGVGPVTVAMLLENTVELAKRQKNKL